MFASRSCRSAGRIDLASALDRLGALECNELLVEAGPAWRARFLDAGFVDELVIYFAPCVLGDTALPMFRLPTLQRMEERRDFGVTEAVRIGEDLRIVLQAEGRSALMFTGIIRGLGRLRSIDSRSGDASLVVDTGTLSLTGVGTGDSIAVNGVCLTVTRLEAVAFARTFPARRSD